MENKAGHLTYESDNLAVPEIHTHEKEAEESNVEDASNENKKSCIQFDNLAMPEIHIKSKK